MNAKSRSRPALPHPATPLLPVSDCDRLVRGLPLESGESQPRPQARPH